MKKINDSLCFIFDSQQSQYESSCIIICYLRLIDNKIIKKKNRNYYYYAWKWESLSYHK